MKSRLIILICVVLIKVGVDASSLEVVLHRNKRSCAIDYSSCGYGCCANGAGCGYNYYLKDNKCLGPVVCPSGYAPCASSSNRCCRKYCNAGTLTCDGDKTYGGTYCCPPDTGCCPPTYAGTGGLCCSTTCPNGYSSCGYGCCATGTTCGFGYYSCGNNKCCGPVTCSSGYAACPSAANHCCRISCSSGTACTKVYNKKYGGIYGACYNKSGPCGTPPGACCPPNPLSAYTPFCNYGTCKNGYCTYQ